MSEASHVRKYLEEARESFGSIEAGVAEEAAILLHRVLAGGGKVLVCGNGGSAADASHFAGELVGRFRTGRNGLPAVSLSSDPAVITAIGNDFGFEHVFLRQVDSLGAPGDILMALTTSGTSENVVRASLLAREKGLKVIALTSAACGTAEWADLHWKASTAVTSHAQEQMLTILHAICHAVEVMLETRQ